MLHEIVNLIHKNLIHIGANMLQYEIERRGLYINKLIYIIREFVSKCEICIIHKLNKFIKPCDKQIISKKPLERLLADITYFHKKIELTEFREKYLLCFTDHFSKFAKCYLIDNKESITVLEKFKNYIEIYNKLSILHTDNGGEFTSNIFNKFCKENDIKFIHGSPRHPRSQGAVEAFNKTIIEKLKFLKIEQGKDFDIHLALDKAVDIYNNCVHSTIKIEPIKAFAFKSKKN